MEKELKDRWVAALRSGKYKQGRYRLRQCYTDERSTTYCCLGVLADVVDPNGWRIGMSEEHITAGDGGGMLRRSWASKIGLTTRNSKSGRMSQHKLVELNDQYTTTFEDIADVIEKEF